jgi:uncharacterized membrane protein
VLFLLYPVLVDVAVATGRPAFAFAAMCLLAMMTLPGYYARLGAWTWPVAAAWTALSWAVCFGGDGLYLLYLPPVLISLVLMLFFGRTLRAGSEPLITRISRAMRGGVLPEEVSRYTRRVTILWVVMFGLLALESALLAAFAPPRIWSLFTNLIDYLIIAAVMLAEYLYHSRRYPNGRHHNFLDFARDLVRVDYRRILFD